MSASAHSNSGGRRFSAILTILLILAAVAIHTSFIVRHQAASMRRQARSAAFVAARAIAASSADAVADTSRLQSRIDAIYAAYPDAERIDVSRREGNGYMIIASTDASQKGRQLSESFPSNPDAAFISAPGGNKTGAWVAAVPFPGPAVGQYLLTLTLASPSLIGAGRADAALAMISFLIAALIITLILFSRWTEHDNTRPAAGGDQIDFVSMAAHELRSPITALRGYLSLFLENAFGKTSEQQYQILQTLAKISAQLGETVDDLLEVSRIDQRRISMNVAPTHPEEIIDDLIMRFSPDAEAKKVTLAFERPKEPLPPILVDRMHFMEALANLFSNAVKYTPSGAITVTAHPVSDGVEIKITDTGIGIAKEDKAKLFTRFFRVKNEQTRGIPGTGLGLLVTKNFIEMMRGSLRIDSVPGAGTQASVVVPKAAPQKKSAEADS